ncbi:MAG: hypothetical protein ABI382_01235 [Nakamurella sp.]
MVTEGVKKGVKSVGLVAIVAVAWTLFVTMTTTTAFAADAVAPATRSGALPRGDLLIQNYSFEDDLVGWTSSCDAAASITTEQHVAGAKALRLTSSGSCVAPTVSSALVTTTHSEKHTAFVQVRAVSGSATANLVFYNSAKQLLSRGPLVQTRAAGWTTLKPTATAPATARYVSVVIGAASGGSIYADDVRISRQFTNVGPRLFQDGYVRAATFGADRVGRSTAYVVTDGGRSTPAHLNVIDVERGQLVRSLALNSGAPSGSWAITLGSTGTVYIASFQPGILWAYHPGATSMIKVAAMRGTQVPFALAADTSGGVYFGGYPDGIVYHYVSGKGVKKFVSAKTLTGQNYVRSLAVDPTTSTVYVGVGARAAVLACDAATAKCTNILPTALRAQQFAYQLSAAPGKVFVYMSPGNELAVLDVTKRSDSTYGATVSATFPKVSYPGASAAVDGTVYYRGAGGALHAYQLAAGTDTVAAATFPDTRGWGSAILVDQVKFPGRSLLAAGTVPGGVDITTYSIASGTTVTQRITGLIGATVNLEYIHRGPDQNIYTGGYLTGGLAAYAPMRSDLTASIAGVGQTESMATLGDKLYLGVYPKSLIQSYTPGQPAATGKNPAKVCEMAPQGQDRPYAMVEGAGKLYIGTMAGYGNLKGALTVYDPVTGTCEVHKDLIRDQSIVSLAYSNGIVYGGSLVWGGLGASPKQSRASLLVFNTATGTATSVPVPVAAGSLEGLTVASNGNIWMMAQNWLLIYSPESGKFVFKTQLFKDLRYPTAPFGATSRTSAYDAFLTTGADGKVYGTLHGRYFFRLDAHDKAPVVLYRGAVSGLTTDSFGNLYFTLNGDGLARYVP